MQQQQQPQQLRVTRDELQAVDDLLLAVRGAVLIQDVDAATTTADTARTILHRVLARLPDQRAVVVQPAPAPAPQQPELRVTHDELQAVDNFLLATRGTVLIQDVNAATTTIDTARAILHRVFARLPDQRAVVVQPAPAPTNVQPAPASAVAVVAQQPPAAVVAPPLRLSTTVVCGGVEVRTSGLPGAGLGLFAVVNFERNARVTEYTGEYHASQLSAARVSLQTHMVHFRGITIDGLKQPDPARGAGSFANDPATAGRYNVALREGGATETNKLFLYATKDIRAGEELFFDYGKGREYAMGRKQKRVITLASGEETVVTEHVIPRWERPDKATRKRLQDASSTSTSDAVEHDRGAQLAFALTLARDAYHTVHPTASWDDANPLFLHESPLKSFYRLVLRIHNDGLREGEVVLERETEGRVSGLAVYEHSKGRRDEIAPKLLGFASRAGLGDHLHQQLVRDVRRRYPVPSTLHLDVKHCIAQLSWFYKKNGWTGDGKSGSRLLLKLEDVPRPRGRNPDGKQWNGRLGEWVEVEKAADVVRRVYTLYDAESDALQAATGSYSLNYTPASVHTITTLLRLEDGVRVLWVGAGDGREALSVALLHPECRIVAIERNAALVNIARRVKASLSVPNIRIEHADATHLPSIQGYTHLFSTALSGDAFYRKLCGMLRPTQRAVLFAEMWCGKQPTIDVRTATIPLSGSAGRRQLRAATIKGRARAGAPRAADPVAKAVAATTPPSPRGRGVKRRVREEEGEEEEDEEDEGEGEEQTAVAQGLSALDYLVMALADGELTKRPLLARAAALGCASNSSYLGSYLAPARRAKDGLITEYLQSFALTPKGRRHANELVHTVTVSDPEAASAPAVTTTGAGAASPSERVKLCVVDHICLALAEHGRLSRADLIRCVSEGGCDSENVGRYLGQKRREKRGMFDLDDENFVLTKEGAQLAVNLGVEPTYVQGRRGGP